MVQKSVNGTRASKWCQRQSVVPEPISGAGASQWCQSLSVVPEPISGAGASQWCRGHSILRATPGMQPNYLCDSMYYALLPEGNRSALVYIYIYIYILGGGCDCRV